MTESKAAAKAAKSEFKAGANASLLPATKSADGTPEVKDATEEEKQALAEQMKKDKELVVTEAPKPVAIRDIAPIPSTATIEFDGAVAEGDDNEAQIALVRAFIRNAVLRMFNLNVANGLKVSKAQLSMNSNSTSLRLPKVKTKPNGDFDETLEVYYNRAIPSIRIWMLQSLTNARKSEARITSAIF